MRGDARRGSESLGLGVFGRRSSWDPRGPPAGLGALGRRGSKDESLNRRGSDRRFSDLKQIQQFNGCLGVSGDDVALGKDSIDNYMSVVKKDVCGRAPMRYADLARDQVRQRYGSACVVRRDSASGSDGLSSSDGFSGVLQHTGAFFRSLQDLDSTEEQKRAKSPAPPASPPNANANYDQRLAAIESALVSIAGAVNSRGLGQPPPAAGNETPIAESSRSSTDAQHPLNFIRQAVGMPAQPPAASSLDTLEA